MMLSPVQAVSTGGLCCKASWWVQKTCWRHKSDPLWYTVFICIHIFTQFTHTPSCSVLCTLQWHFLPFQTMWSPSSERNHRNHERLLRIESVLMNKWKENESWSILPYDLRIHLQIRDSQGSEGLRNNFQMDVKFRKSASTKLESFPSITFAI